MEYTYPDYYRKFACIGGECKDNCCAAGWQIAIDEESLRMYEKLEGDIGVRLRNSIDWENGMFEQFDHKCSLLNEKGLCDVYCDAGEDKMCVLCRRYPRHYEEYENLREISLSVSCPEAARIVLTNRGKVGYFTEEDDNEEEYDDFDYLMFTKLQDIRGILLEVMQSGEGSYKLRMAKVLDITHRIQRLIDRERIFEIDEQETRAKTQQSGYKGYACRYKERRQYMKGMMECLHRLEVLKPDWTDLLNESEELLYVRLTDDEYARLCMDFEQYYAERTEEYEQLMVYFIYTYFCGSVYDYEPESKIRFGLAAVLLIYELDMAFWSKNGSLKLEDQIEIVHRYSKEVEHSDLNLDDMERMVMKDAAFGYRKFMTAIMSR